MAGKKEELREQMNVEWLKAIRDTPIDDAFTPAEEKIIANFFRLGFMAGRTSGINTVLQRVGKMFAKEE